jgi:hypothetical protein
MRVVEVAAAVKRREQAEKNTPGARKREMQQSKERDGCRQDKREWNSKKKY